MKDATETTVRVELPPVSRPSQWTSTGWQWSGEEREEHEEGLMEELSVVW